MWATRRAAIEAAMSGTRIRAVRRAGDDYLHAIDQYKTAAANAGSGFVEIHSTLLFGVVGQREQ